MVVIECVITCYETSVAKCGPCDLCAVWLGEPVGGDEGVRTDGGNTGVRTKERQRDRQRIVVRSKLYHCNSCVGIIYKQNVIFISG